MVQFNLDLNLKFVGEINIYGNLFDRDVLMHVIFIIF
jgi:hypothetical protein